MKKIKWIRLVAFCMIMLVLFSIVQQILMRDWSDADNIFYIVRGINQIDEDCAEVIFVGASQVENGVSPMKLYQDTGIVSYSVATSAQLLSGSYYALKAAFQKQSPSLVVMDPGTLFSAAGPGMEGDNSWRYILDNLPFGKLKIEMAKEYSEAVSVGDFLSGLIPLLKYHTRVWELTENDFRFRKEQFYYSAGTYVTSAIVPTPVTVEGINNEVDILLTMVPGTKQYIENGTAGEASIDTPLYAPTISKYALENMQRIIQLCKENDAELLFVKIPNMKLTSQYGGSWTQIKSDMVRSYAVEQGIPYYDMIYDLDQFIDFTTDTVDGGIHLNIRGVEKVTQVLGRYLLDNYSFTCNNNEEYDLALEKYKKVREIAYLQSETVFQEYLRRILSGIKGYTVLIAACDDYAASLTEDEMALFDQLGLQLISQGNFRDSYMAIIEGGDVRYEAVSDRRINKSIKVNNISITMVSSGWYTTPIASIVVDGKEYAMNGCGLNFVIIDNETGFVVDSTTFNTNQVGKTALRNSIKDQTLLRNYEDAVCFKR